MVYWNRWRIFTADSERRVCKRPRPLRASLQWLWGTPSWGTPEHWCSRISALWKCALVVYKGGKRTRVLNSCRTIVFPRVNKWNKHAESTKQTSSHSCRCASFRVCAVCCDGFIRTSAARLKLRIFHGKKKDIHKYLTHARLLSSLVSLVCRSFFCFLLTVVAQPSLFAIVRGGWGGRQRRAHIKEGLSKNSAFLFPWRRSPHPLGGYCPPVFTLSRGTAQPYETLRGGRLTDDGAWFEVRKDVSSWGKMFLHAAFGETGNLQIQRFPYFCLGGARGRFSL